MRDLLRVIRNKRHHYHELSPPVKALVGALPVGFCNYFDRRFPLLLSHCVEVAKKFLSTERLFSMLFYRDTSITPTDSPSVQEISNNNTANSSKKMSSGSSVVPNSMKSDFNSSKTVSSSPSKSDPNSLKSFISNFNEQTVGTESTDDTFTDAESGQFLNSNNNEASQSCQNSDGGYSLSTGSSVGYSGSSGGTPSVVCADGVVVWQGSALQQSLRSKGWWRDAGDWVAAGQTAGGGPGGGGGVIGGGGAKKNRPSHLVKAASDLKYRTRLCTHWETTVSPHVPMIE